MTETIEENISIKTIGSFTICEGLAPDERDATDKVLNINGLVEVFDIVYNKEEATHIFINSHTDELAKYEKITNNWRKTYNDMLNRIMLEEQGNKLSLFIFFLKKIRTIH